MHVKDLYIYPVKSFAGQRVSSARLAPRGFEHDRRWMLIDKNGRFISQREHAGLCRWEAQVDGEELRLIHLDDSRSITVQNAFATTGERTTVAVFDKIFEARLVPGFDATLLEQELDMSCRLVYMAPDCHREITPQYAKPGEEVSFADGYPYLIANESTRTELGQRFGEDLDMRRFRPNIVVAGAAPFAEDHWENFVIGTATFRVPKPCARCIVTTIDPDNGRKNSAVFKHLVAHRKVDNKVVFGVNGILDTPSAATIQVGDSFVLR